MRTIIIKLVLVFLAFGFFSPVESIAQKAPKCLKVAKTNRPNWVKISNGDLVRFYRNFTGDVAFGNMKLVKSELAYYLIADEQNGNRIFAFELEQKGKRLFLKRELPVQTCSEGTLSLDTFLQENGKIQGCRVGNHAIKKVQ